MHANWAVLQPNGAPLSFFSSLLLTTPLLACLPACLLPCPGMPLGQYYNMMEPSHKCARNLSLDAPPTPNCVAHSKERMAMLARFCWQADLANEDGAEYVVSKLGVCRSLTGVPLQEQLVE